MVPGWIAPLLLAAAPDPARPEVAPPRAVPPAEAAHLDALARYGAGLLQARRERLLSAAKDFEAAAKLDPDSTAALKELVHLYPLVGREPEAIRAARKVLEKDPADADTAHALGRLLADAGEYTDAAAALARAAGSPAFGAKPDQALVVLRELGTVRERAGDAAGAEAALRRALTLLGERRKAFTSSGLFSAREVDAETATTLERLGTVLTAQRKFGPAAAAFRDAAARYGAAADPTSAARLGWNLSGVEAARGDPVAALTHLDSFLKLKPQNLEPYERLVSLYQTAGQTAAVVSRLRALIRDDPNNLSLKATYAGVLAGRQDRFVEALLVELGRATNDPGVVRVVVRAWVEYGTPAKVLQELDEAYKAVDDEPTPGAEPKTAAARAFLAEKARVVADVLRDEARLAETLLRTAVEDLRAGTDRTRQTWHLMGLLAARHRKLDEAETLFRRAAAGAGRGRAGPDDTTAMLELIRVLWRKKKYADVAEMCRDGIRRSGMRRSPVTFYYHLSLALAELRDTDGALDAADKAIAPIGGGTARLSVRLGKVSVLERLGKWADAVTYCQQLLDACDNPADRAKVRYALAGAYWGAKKPAESEAELRGILDDDPDHAGACNDLGYHLADQGRNPDEAERLVRHAIATDRAERRRTGDPEPDNAAYLDSLGWVLFRKGDLSGAKEWLGKAAAMPDGAADAVVWDHLGDVHFRLGEKDRAKACWETAAKLYETDRRGTAEGRTDEVKRKLRRVP